MNEVSKHTGNRIRCFRKTRGMTLQQLADAIHKSRASVSKYENGEIILDIETLYDISEALQVDLNQLIDYQPKKPAVPSVSFRETIGKSPFFQADLSCGVFGCNDFGVKGCGNGFDFRSVAEQAAVCVEYRIINFRNKLIVKLNTSCRHGCTFIEENGAGSVCISL